MDESDELAEAANLIPRVTGAINDLRTYAFFLTDYIDVYRRTGNREPGTMRNMTEQLVDKTAYLTEELTVIKAFFDAFDRQ